MSPQEYSQAILDLVKLRQTDYDAFMEKLYELLTGDLKTAIYDSAPVQEKTDAISTMMDYFSQRDEFEKCAELKKLKEDLEKKSDPEIKKIFA
jgi:hypothetical protein